MRFSVHVFNRRSIGALRQAKKCAVLRVKPVGVVVNAVLTLSVKVAQVSECDGFGGRVHLIVTIEIHRHGATIPRLLRKRGFPLDEAFDYRNQLLTIREATAWFLTTRAVEVPINPTESRTKVPVVNFMVRTRTRQIPTFGWRSLLMTGVLGSLALSLVGVTEVAATVAAGTPAQVSALVAASTKITHLSSAMQAKLPTASDDFNWGSACATLGSCVQGDATSSKVVVVFGDSHALMWMPAINPTALAHHVKIQLIWLGGCPAATVSIYYPVLGDPARCNQWRASTIQAIKKINPAVVLLGGRAFARSSPTSFFSSDQWASGLETTITALKSSTTKVGVIEDTVGFSAKTVTCLSTYPNAVQKCSAQWPTTKAHGTQAGELKAAKVAGATFIKTHQWFCTTSCSMVIGGFFPFVDQDHVSTTYSAYLSAVMRAELKPLF